MIARALFLGLTGALLFPGALLSAQEGERSLDSLLRDVRVRGDETSAETYQAIAAFGGEEAFSTLRKATEFIRLPGAYDRLFASYVRFQDDDELLQRTLELFSEYALGATRLAQRTEATRAFRHFGEAGYPLLEQILRSSSDSRVRAIALRPLVPILFAREEPGALGLVLDNAYLAVPGIAEGILALEGDWAREVVLARIRDGAPDYVLVLLLEWVEQRPGPGVDAVISLLEHPTTLVRLRALRVIASYGALGEVEEQLWELYESKDSDARIAGIEGLVLAGADEKRLSRELKALIKKRDPTLRIAGVRGWARVGGDEGYEVLQELVDDKQWSVRAVVLEELVVTRRQESLALLMERLDEEEGRMLELVVNALARLTGLELGMKAETWRRWWKDEGQAFEVPEEAPVIDVAAASVATSGSFASFYGLPVNTSRLTFVVDASGSMLNSDEGNPRTRWEIATAQVLALVERIPDRSHCNLIFFDDEVEAWRDESVQVTNSWRRKLERFVSAREPGGNTNIYDALELAAADPEIDTIYLLSDGEPNRGQWTTPEVIRSQVAIWAENRKLQVHCISVGTVSPLLEGLALDSGGRYEEVDVAPVTYMEHAWNVVRQARRGDADYEKALAWAGRAHRAAPDQTAMAVTLGAALYRLDRHQEAVELLASEAEKLETSGARPTLAHYAFLVMVLSRLERLGEAEDTIIKLEGQPARDGASLRLRREALTVFEAAG